MAAREFHHVLVNQWESPLFWITDQVDDGEWQDPFYPSKVPGAGHIDPAKEGEWRSESNALIAYTGTSGKATWGVRVNDVFDGDHFEYIEIKWDLDYFNDANAGTHAWSSVSRVDPKNQDAFVAPDKRPCLLECVPALRDANGNARAIEDGYSSVISEMGAYVIILPVSFFTHSFFANALKHPRVDWIVRRKAGVGRAATALQAESPIERSIDASRGVIYVVEPTLEPTFHAVEGALPASGGNLKWARHVGRVDGSFRWEGPNTVKKGWSDFKQSFSAGGGILYGVTPVVPAAPATELGLGKQGRPVSGGDLIWHRHTGWQDGSFRWEEPKKVGTGWGDFEHLFSGDDGIIYGVTTVVPAIPQTGLDPRMRARRASGGDLMWYRHVGRRDGSFQWQGPKQIGTGWGSFKHLFSGGDGIIYGVTAVVDATVTTRTGLGAEGQRLGMEWHRASGGDLVWYRHVGREDGTFRWEGPRTVGTGWGAFKHVFAGSDGVIYVVTEGGDLKWYRHTGREDGSFQWEAGEGKTVGIGWDVRAVFSA